MKPARNTIFFSLLAGVLSLALIAHDVDAKRLIVAYCS